MFYLLYGQDTYRRNARVAELKAAYRDKNPQALGFTIFSDEDALEKLGDALVFGGGLFEEKRFIVCRDHFLRHGPELTDLLKGSPARADKNINAVFLEGDVEKAVGFAEFKKLCYADKFGPLDNAKLRLWIKDYLVKNHRPKMPQKISSDALSLLLGLGPDLWRLSAEMEKLLAFCLGRPEIQKNDVLTLVNFADEQAVFELSNSVYSKQKVKALGVVARLLFGNGQPDGLISYTIKEARNLARAHAALKEQNLAGFAEVFDVKPFPWQKKLNQARQWSEEESSALLDKAVELELAWKGGKDKRLALDKFILSV